MDAMRYRLLILIFFGLCHLAPPPTWAQTQPVLLVRSYDTQKTLLSIPLSYGQTLTLRYIHSVDRTPVFEVFTANRDHGLILEETYFRQFGAGMGHWPGHGKVISDGEWIRIINIHKALGRFVLRVGSPGVDHTLIMHGREWNLSKRASGCRVEILLASNNE